MTNETPLPESTILNPAIKRPHPSSSSEHPTNAIPSTKPPTNPDHYHPHKKPQRTKSKSRTITHQTHDGKTRRPSTKKTYSLEELNRCLVKAQERLTLTRVKNQKECISLRLAEENDSIRIEYIREKIRNHTLTKEKEGLERDNSRLKEDLRGVRSSIKEVDNVRMDLERKHAEEVRKRDEKIHQLERQREEDKKWIADHRKVSHARFNTITTLEKQLKSKDEELGKLREVIEEKSKVENELRGRVGRFEGKLREMLEIQRSDYTQV